MKLCDAHREELHKQIDAAGLYLHPINKHMAAKYVEEVCYGPVTKSNFKPLMVGATLLHAQALHSGGAYMLSVDENGNEYCPVCEADKHEFYGWIEAAVKRLLEFAQKL